MTPQEFKKRLRQLQETILRACCFQKVWLTLQFRDDKTASWSLDEQNRMLHQFPGFFNNVCIAMQEAALLNFAKVFDSDPRTASLSVLLSAAKRSPSLVPRLTTEDLREFGRRLGRARTTLKGLQQVRDQRLAHHDANPAESVPILIKDLDQLSMAIEEIYNGLSTGHDGNFYDWRDMLVQADRDTAAIMNIILSDLERRRAESEAAREASRA